MGHGWQKPGPSHLSVDEQSCVVAQQARLGKGLARLFEHIGLCRCLVKDVVESKLLWVGLATEQQRRARRARQHAGIPLLQFLVARWPHSHESRPRSVQSDRMSTGAGSQGASICTHTCARTNRPRSTLLHASFPCNARRVGLAFVYSLRRPKHFSHGSFFQKNITAV